MKPSNELAHYTQVHIVLCCHEPYLYIIHELGNTEAPRQVEIQLKFLLGFVTHAEQWCTAKPPSSCDNNLFAL